MNKLAALFIASSVYAAAAANAATLVTFGDASISQDESGAWTLSSAGASLTLVADAHHDFRIGRFTTASSFAWVGGLADTFVTFDDVRLSFGSRTGGFVFRSVTTDQTADTLGLHATYDLPSRGLRLTRHYRVAAGSPSFEVWTSYRALESPVPGLWNLNALSLAVPSGVVHWLEGLGRSTADVADAVPFTRRARTLEPDESLTFGATGRSSETTVPWLAVAGATETFFSGLMWSGAWRVTVDRRDDRLFVAIDLGDMQTTVDEREVDGPHVVIGLVAGGIPEATMALQDFIVGALRHGVPLDPLVTYNTWFAHGVRIDDETVRKEMEEVARIGAELFVLDAGWYAGSGGGEYYEYLPGLGNYEPDRSRFPDGLGSLADYAHALGLKFGIWVEPERVDLAVVGAPGPQEDWLATREGSYGMNGAAQICFASAEARLWVLDRLSQLIEAVRPDYLKWDNNAWINCDRDGHGHGPSDGNFGHVGGLYEVLAALKERYPNLLIENVSGGGNRLDLGMIRVSDAGWMDDRTIPSVHVRHNVEGLSLVFPTGYLLSFLMHDETEPLYPAPDLSLYARSRMLGAFGLTFKSHELPESALHALANEIEVYKRIRSTLGAGVLLTAQALAPAGNGWDALQSTRAPGSPVLIAAFQTDPGADRVILRPVGLDPEAAYEVHSLDLGFLDTATGDALMIDGLALYASPASAAHLLMLVPATR